MEKIRWTGRMRYEALQRGKEERNILHTVKNGKANRTGHISCRQSLQKQRIEGNVEGKIDVMERRERRSKQLLDDLTN